MIPHQAPDRKRRARPYVVYGLVAANVLVFLYTFFLNELDALVFGYRFGVIPFELTGGESLGRTTFFSTAGASAEVDLTSPVPTWATMFTAMFVHISFLHVAGNMWFLWRFGSHLEDRLGLGRFLGFYLLAGIAAVWAQVLVDASSHTPMVGASGGIAGVLGAYWLLYPRDRGGTTAIILLGFFVFPGLLTLVGVFGIISYAAHVGGLAAGIVVGASLRLRAGWHTPQPQHQRDP